jgi:hypothetical protein
MRLFMPQSPTQNRQLQDTPDWWATVQQDRDEFPADQLESWLSEEISFAPDSGRARRDQPPVTPTRPTRRFQRTEAENRVLSALDDLGDNVGQLATAAPTGRTGSFDVVLTEDGTLVATETLAPSSLPTDELVLTVPPVLERPTVTITGHPEQVSGSRALRHRERSLMDLIGPHPDRIAFWVVLLGVMLIVLSQLSS